MSVRNSIKKFSFVIYHFIRKVLLIGHRKILRHPKVTLVVFFVLATAGALLATQLRINLLVDDMMDPEFETYSELVHLNKTFPEKNTALLLIGPKHPKTSLNKKSICAIRHWVLDVADRQKNLIEVNSSFGARRTELVDGQLRLPRLLEPDCAQLDKNEVESLADGFAKLRSSPWKGILVGQKNDDILIQFQFSETEPNHFWLYPDKSKTFRSNTVLNLKQSFENTVIKPDPQVTAVWGGVATFQGLYQEAYDHANILNILSLVLVFIVMKLLFGTFRSGFLYIFSFLAAVAPIFGAMALFKTPVDVLSNSIGLMIMISTLEDFLFLSFYMQNAKAKWRKTFRKFLVPSFYTTLTTFIGFGSLAIGDLEIIKRFGIWAALGSLFQYLSAFYFLPALLKVFPKLSLLYTKQLPIWKWVEYFKNLQLPKWIGLSSSFLFFLSLFAVHRVVVSDAPTQIFPDNHYANMASREFLDQRGWQATISVVFNANSTSEFNKSVIADLKKQEGIEYVENRYDIQDYFYSQMPSYFYSGIDQLWGNSSSFHRLVNPSSGDSRAIAYVSHQDIQSVKKLNKWVKDRCQGQCHLSGSLVSYSEFGEKVLKTLLESLLVSLVLVSAVLAFLCIVKDVKSNFPILMSAIWGPLGLICFFVVFQVPIFYITSMFASILVGLAGDNSIQFVFSKGRGSPTKGADRLGVFSIFITIAMSVLTSILFFSHFAALQKLGLIMIAGFLTMLIGDIVILRSLTPPDSRKA